jgi:fumarate reductase subunit C
MVVRLRGTRVPPLGLTAPIYLIWAAVSALVAWLVLGG